MTKLLSMFYKLDSLLYAAQKVMILAGVVAMVVINGAQVFCRYVVKSSLAWSEQTSVLLFFVLIMLGANLAVKSDSETKIDILRFKNVRADAALRLVADVLSSVAVVVFLASALSLLDHARHFPQYLSSIKLDYFYIYIWLLVGFILVLIDKIINILKNVCRIAGIALPDGPSSAVAQREKEEDQS